LGNQSAWIWGSIQQEGDNQDIDTQRIPIHERDTASVRINRDTSTKRATREVTITCKSYLQSYISYGANNYREDVRRLERYLNTYQGESLPVDGRYAPHDVAAVKRLQAQYRERILEPWGMSNPSGRVYKTTRDFINTHHCLANQPDVDEGSISTLLK
jgi:hypothetical protein